MTDDKWEEVNILSIFQLNTKKSCGMVFNFTKKYQFTSRLTLDGEPIKLVEETKLLGVILTSDLKWSKNTEY